MELREALEKLSHLDDSHFTKGGLPDLNHLKEATGGKVTREDVEALVGKKTRTDYEGEALVGNNSDPAGRVEPEGEGPTSSGPLTPEEIGAKMIDSLDAMLGAMSPEVRQKQPEIFQVLQLFQAERPSIVERQKRLEARANR